ncbi:hypothetical protein RQP46_004560 [Phenoliferia psychrophenolica]
MSSAAQHEEEDLDDLDDLVDEFAPTPASTSTSTPSPSLPKPSRAVPVPGAAPPQPDAAAGSDFDFDDPDDLPLDGLDLEGEDFAHEFQQSMAQLMGQLGDGDDDEAREFQKMMQGMLSGDMAGLLGGAGGPGGADLDPAALLAALSGTGPSSSAAPAPAAKAKGKKATAPAAGPSAPATPANFQDTIKQTMNKMRDSSTTVDAEAEARAAAGAGVDPLAAMMAQMAGLGDMGDIGGADGLQGMLDEMMGQLMSRDLLYVPLKELSDKYPAYLKENESTLDVADVARFKKQQSIVDAIVAKFDEPGADVEDANMSEEEQAKQTQRQSEIADLVKEMNDCGAPPAEIMGDMPEGMEIGPDGVPKLPTDCTIS